MTLSRRAFFFGAPAVLILGAHMRIRPIDMPAWPIIHVDVSKCLVNEKAAFDWLQLQFEKELMSTLSQTPEPLVLNGKFSSQVVAAIDKALSEQPNQGPIFYDINVRLIR